MDLPACSVGLHYQLASLPVVFLDIIKELLLAHFIVTSCVDFHELFVQKVLGEFHAEVYLSVFLQRHLHLTNTEIPPNCELFPPGINDFPYGVVDRFVALIHSSGLLVRLVLLCDLMLLLSWLVMLCGLFLKLDRLVLRYFVNFGLLLL